MPARTFDAATIAYVAQKAWFFFIVYDFTYLQLGAYVGDASNISGEGVDTLDEIKELLERPAPSRFRIQMDIGALQAYFIDVTAEDITNIRAAYVAVYGEVNKPNVYGPIPVSAGS